MSTRRRASYETNHFLGASAKFIRSTLAEAFRADAVAADAGYLLQAPDLGLSAGLSMLNLGSNLRYRDDGESDPLPVTFRGGAAYEPKWVGDLSFPPGQRLIVAADVEYLYHERIPRGNLGLEYAIYERQCLRLGYQIDPDVLGLTFGFGAAWRDLRFDYAWSAASEFTDSHRFNVTYRFGKVSRGRREARRRVDIEDLPGRDEIRGGIDEAVPRSMERSGERPRREPEEPRPRLPGWIY